MLNSVALAASSRSASSKISVGLLPLSSNTTFFRFDCAEAIWIALPVLVVPVKERARMRICEDIAASTAPWPERTLMTPGGKPYSAIHCAVF